MKKKIRIANKRPLSLFEGYGVEMEYMIVDSHTLDVRPVADQVLKQAAGGIVNEYVVDGMAWSNELVLHVIEIKTGGPALSLHSLAGAFMEQILAIEQILEDLGLGARLMPGAMHPWMEPFSEVKLWPHEQNRIYEAYNRIFDCRGHGWANLQSTHLNLPFQGDEEFGRLHAAIRLVLPLIPALAAGSPLADGERKPFLDFRMEQYRTNSHRIPSVTGWVIPEAVFTRTDYEREIFQRMYNDIAPFDPEGILRDEWLNSRGAMSRWDRQAIEIRVIDNQEYPGADIAILEWVVNLVKALTDEKWVPLKDQKVWSETDLYHILKETVAHAEQAMIENRNYLSLFGIPEDRCTAGELSHHLYQELKKDYSFSGPSRKHLELIFKEGPLARRILRALPPSFTKNDLVPVYSSLCDCLRHGKAFVV